VEAKKGDPQNLNPEGFSHRHKCRRGSSGGFANVSITKDPERWGSSQIEAKKKSDP